MIDDSNLELLLQQIENEERTHKYNQASYVRECIEESGVYDVIADLDMPITDEPELDKKIWSSLLLSSLLHQRALPETLIASISKYFDHPQSAANLVEFACDNKILRYARDGFIYSMIALSAETLAEIENYGYPLPSVVKPTVLTHNADTGYQSDKASKGSCLLNDAYLDDDHDLNLDHLNALNAIELTHVNHVIESIPLLPPTQKVGESDKDFKSKIKAHKKFVRCINQGLELVADSFYLTHAFDRRGRTYCRGYHFSYQGKDFNKAAITFARKESLK